MTIVFCSGFISLHMPSSPCTNNYHAWVSHGLIVFIMFVFFQISRVNLMCKQNQSILSKTHLLILALYLKKLCFWNFFVQPPIPFCRLTLHSRKKLNEYPFDHWIWCSILLNTTKPILCAKFPQDYSPDTPHEMHSWVWQHDSLDGINSFPQHIMALC